MSAGGFVLAVTLCTFVLAIVFVVSVEVIDWLIERRHKGE